MRVGRVMDGVMDGDNGDGFSTKKGQKMSQRRIFQGIFRSIPCIVWLEAGCRCGRGIVSLRRRHSVPTLDTQLCAKGRNSNVSGNAIVMRLP